MELAIIYQKIYEIRGQKVMLDYDLAGLYEVPTRVLNQAVKRNLKRFPKDFMFTLTPEEVENLRSQNVISSWGGKRYMPAAFTEHGVTMLASVLKSEKAIDMNIAIVRAFIALRQFVLNYNDLSGQIKEIRMTVENHDEQLGKIYGAIEKLLEEKATQKSWDEREMIGFKQMEDE